MNIVPDSVYNKDIAGTCPMTLVMYKIYEIIKHQKINVKRKKPDRLYCKNEGVRTNERQWWIYLYADYAIA